MKVFNKLANILFDYDPDEEEEDIPVITKESEESKKAKRENTRKEQRENRKKVEDGLVVSDVSTDDVIVTKIESAPVVSKDKESVIDEMPKFRSLDDDSFGEEKPFSFPIIDDDLEDKKETRSSKNRNVGEEKRSSKRFDYLSSTEYKVKSDSYTASRNNIYEKSESKKPFTLSPIISPVYGILNENYKKEDIVSTSSSRRGNQETVDLDSVRRKAYGTLEDEIEETLNKKDEDILEEVPTKSDMTLENLKDDGISINDLLVDDEPEIEDNSEVFDIEMDPNEEVDIDEEVEKKDEKKGQEATEEEDLFDLIDSIYAGKEEE